MNAKQALLKNIKNSSLALCTSEQIARKLKLGRREEVAVRDLLNELVREGELLKDGRGRYGTALQFCAQSGTITGNERGFGFFAPDDGSKDLFIPRHALKGALHGDKVLCCPVDPRRGDEGEVLAILSRGMRELVGTVYRKGREGILKPDERKFSENVFLPAGKLNGCKDGQKALVRILSYEGVPSGEVREVLGESGDLMTEERALIRAYALREQFPAPVLEEAARLKAISDEEIRGRKDLRELLTITVDGEDTRDIDDAISLTKRGDKYLLGVHIADVSHYVKRGSALDGEAFLRGTSVYFPDRVLPMLPKALSNGICSLNEGEDRLTLSCLMTVDGKGHVQKKQIVPSLIRSRHRMTYTQVTAIADGDREAAAAFPDLVGFVKDAVELTAVLKNARRQRGGIALDVKEAKILYHDGKIEVPDYGRTVSHEMIEQFMVLANECVAAYAEENRLPFVYRVHERPSVEKAQDFSVFLKEAGIRPLFDPERVTPDAYRKQLEALEGSPLCSTVNRVMLRSMQKAVYSPENIGHFGLASERYCHFTSPIRRYPDLCVHRILKESFRDGEGARTRYQGAVSEIAKRSSLCERTATDAERDVDALFLVAYMKDKIGETYEATVSGVTGHGIFAELDNTVEGFIPIETLPDDCYEWLEERYMLRGTRHSFHLGERLHVRVEGVDWGARRVTFAFLSKCAEKRLQGAKGMV